MTVDHVTVDGEKCDQKLACFKTRVEAFETCEGNQGHGLSRWLGACLLSYGAEELTRAAEEEATHGPAQ